MSGRIIRVTSVPKMLRSSRIALGLLALVVCVSSLASTNDEPKRRPGDRISTQERLLLIRGLQSEVVYVRRLLPIAKTGAIIKNGQVTPSEQDILKIAADKGIAAKPG